MSEDSRKRRADDFAYSAVVMDIEGTTTPITFVKDVLFPYVKSNVEAYLSETYGEEQTQADIQALREQWQQDSAASVSGAEKVAGADEGKDAIVASCVASVLWQMSIDRKATALKQLQGHMWSKAYAAGTIQGMLYVDVLPALQQWQKAGLPLYIYSSGSIHAQKLLFTYSSFGNVCKMIKGHYDTTTGMKTEKSSYEKIAADIGHPAQSILFLSDNVLENHAAAAAGMQTVNVLREGNAPLSEDDLREIPNFKTFLEVIEKYSPLTAQKRPTSEAEQ